jgi:hypothetical protein
MFLFKCVENRYPNYEMKQLSTRLIETSSDELMRKIIFEFNPLLLIIRNYPSPINKELFTANLTANLLLGGLDVANEDYMWNLSGT